MKVAVIGSRGFDNKELLYEVLDDLKTYEPTLKKIDVIISGGAKGADTIAESYAKEKSIKTQIFKPQYDKFGRGAPLKRNVQIIEASDIVVAFWDGKSPGTKNSIGEANKRNKKVVIIDPTTYKKN